MKVESFRFHDRATGWEFEDARFDAFNLLVGVSGVGKSKILRALGEVQQIGGGHPNVTEKADWTIKFEHDGHRYSWEASTAASQVVDSEGSADEMGERIEFVSERIVRDDAEMLVERSDELFRFEGKSLPRLKRSDCAIALLADERSISPIRRAFNSFIFSDARAVTSVTYFRRKHVDDVLAQHSSVERLREAGRLPALLKAYLLQEVSPPDWVAIKDLFTEVFPSVEDLRIERSRGKLPRKDVDWEFDLVEFCIRERGVENWIRTSAISTGMHRTMIHLIDIFLASPGSVVVIDEFENSLGKNCMPALTDFILSRAPDLQFFITSHHPYIINKIPIDTWKLVRRQGSRVRLLSARDIPALQEASHHDAFDRLLNLPEFEEGIE